MGAMTRVLVANRGEIAVRIIRGCRELGLETVAVFSDPDATALHVRLADRAVRIGPAAPAASYLNMDAIIEAARTTGAHAIHPGYGFLSERSAFAKACEDSGITFVGPSSQAIERMGSKIEARALMASAGVPVVPGATPDDQSDEGLVHTTRAIGYPALIKASAGGGGKGMRAVRSDADAREAAGAARREALAAFGDGTLYVEKLIERPRHVEIQVLGDAHGNIVHLFERECSLQRRHQKIVEESPSPAVTSTVRRRMGEAAVAAARAAGYVNAGTIEFLLEGEGDGARFYFLEMNTRLQVEHPVTEAVTGVDLVRAQLRVAAGETLPWTQDMLSQRGHAIECRVYAEDPASGFLPQAGRLLLYREPSGPGVRVDSGVTEGDEIQVHYDPLIAKLVTSAESREAAVARADDALRTFPILGIRTNVSFLRRLLAGRAFVEGRVDTGFIDRHLDELAGGDEVVVEAVAAAAALAQPAAHPTAVPLVRPDPWTSLTGWGRTPR
jgi:acetyl-CoA carboxylase biotin carboxylase subunit